MMAELAARIGRLIDAENLLRRALELAPSFTAARANLATVLYKQNRPAEAIAILDALLDHEPENAAHSNLKAAALAASAVSMKPIALYEDVLQRFPDQPKVWMSYGHVLKTVGRQADSIAAYRRSIALAPTLGEVWWSLANLKTVSLDTADIERMETALAAESLSIDDRLHLHFALGKALEDAGDAARSFAHYAEGNRLRHDQIGYDPRGIERLVAHSQRLFTPAFFESRSDFGAIAPDPIFIVGMPRAGSTLIEQILASHPLVEGTQELADIPALTQKVGDQGASSATGLYPDAIAQLDRETIEALGRSYLDSTRIQRKTDRPFFIDKLPNNWAHIGLIRLILPKAKIIDARRHPLDCCFSNSSNISRAARALPIRLRPWGAITAAMSS